MAQEIQHDEERGEVAAERIEYSPGQTENHMTRFELLIIAVVLASIGMLMIYSMSDYQQDPPDRRNYIPLLIDHDSHSMIGILESR